MRNLYAVCRIALGLLFTIFGANKWLHFAVVPMPTGDAGAYYTLLFAHHVMAVVAVFEVSGGILLLLGRYVPLGLLLLGPVVANILMYHVLFDATHIAQGLLAAVLEGVLLWGYRQSYASVFTPATVPA